MGDLSSVLEGFMRLHLLLLTWIISTSWLKGLLVVNKGEEFGATKIPAEFLCCEVLVALKLPTN